MAALGTIRNCANRPCFEAEAFKAAGKTADAIRTLESWLDREIRTPDTMRGATVLAQLLRSEGDGTKALRTLEAIHQIALADNIIELNTLTVELGDTFGESSNPRKRSRVTATLIRANRSLGCKTTGSPEWSAG